MTRALALGVLLLATSHAGAQDCGEGRVRSAGLCCWPGQSFSTVTRRCEGVPRCPSGLTEHGASCVTIASEPTQGGVTVPLGYSAAAAPAPEAPAAHPPAQSAAAWPDAHGRTHRAVRVRGRDEELIIMALVIYDVGFAMGWLGAIVDEAQGPCGGSCQSWYYAFIPLIGGATAVMQSNVPGFFGYREGIPLGLLSACLQGVGLVAAAIAVENRTTELRYPASDFTVAFVPAAPGALAGVSLEGTY